MAAARIAATGPSGQRRERRARSLLSRLAAPPGYHGATLPMADDNVSGSSFDEAVRQGRPDGDELRRDHARASLAASLFGEVAEPVRLGRFVLLDRIGQGGMGAVYSAYDPQLDRRVALKLLHPHVAGGSDEQRRLLLREARAAARLSHPSVVAVHDVGVIDDTVFLVMEHVAGVTLRAWLAAAPRSWRDVVDAYMEAGRGLAAAHEAGVVHRDFKPDNALIGDDGRVRVVDFGIARHRPAGPPEPASRASTPPAPTPTAPMPPAPTPPAPTSAAPTPPAPTPSAATAQASIATPADASAADESGPTASASPASPVGRAVVAAAPALSAATPTASGESTAAGAALSAALATTVDRTVIAGTPHYMAPEQLAGEEAGPAADQFAFCVALYEALYGQRPFAGDTLADLHGSVREGRIREPPRDRRVPRRIHVAVYRGLSAHPGQRHRSMAALIATLARERGRVRRTGLVALGLAAACGVAAGVAGTRSADDAGILATCEGGRDDLGAVWSPARSGGVDRAMRATGRDFAQESGPRIIAALDRYGAAWVDMRRDACVRHRDGLQSPVLLDQRMRCLDGRLRALDAAVAVLEQVDARSLDHAINVVEGLPSIAHCADADALAAEVPPPESTVIARQVGELRAQLSRARALEDAGRYDAAQRTAASLVGRAEVTAYPPILADTLLAVGRSRMMIQDDTLAEAADPLRRAAEIAIRQRMWATAVEALARWFYVDAGRARDGGAELRALIPFAEAVGEHVVGDDLARPLLLNNIGIVHMRDGDRVRARDYFERALREMERSASPPLELTAVRRNLAMLTPEPARRDALMQQELARLEGRLGASHPWTLGLRLAHAHYTADLARARSLLAPTCELYERFHADQVDPYISCLYYLGFLTERLGDREQAARILTRAADLGDTDDADREMVWDELARGYALHFEGRHAEALTQLRSVVERLSSEPDAWWVAQRTAHARLGMGLCAAALGDERGAIRDLESAIAAFDRLRTINQDVEHAQRLAAAREALAALSDAAAPAPVTGRASR
jgi:serine/threonine protein kinase/tetratricopeptide (TPR) repeat protein